MPITIPEPIMNALKIAFYVLGAYAAALYLGLVVWTARDIASRSRDWLVRILAVLMVLVFNFAGLVLYLILRPRETLADVYGRSLEEEALLQNIEGQTSCPNCHRRVDEDYMVCPNCRTALKARCSSCSRLLSHNWDVCPYCGEEQPGQATRVKPAATTTPTPPDEAIAGAP